MKWKKVKLTEICKPKQWKNLPISELTEEGYPVYGANGIIGRYKEYNHEHPTLAITCRGATCGTINITHAKSYITSNAMALNDLSNEIDQMFLYYALNKRGFKDVITGAAQPQITREGLSKITLDIPESKDDQLHIANLLSKAENLIAQRKESIRLLDEFLKSTFLEMFGDPVRNEKGWDVKQLGKVTFMKAGQFVSASDIQSVSSEGLYSCYGGNGLRGYVKTYTHEGDFVLIGRQGALCGNVKIAKGQFHATEHAVVCSPKMQYETNWLYYLLDIVNLNKYASGAAQPGLAVGRLEQIEIIYPPIELQTQFAQIVEKTEALKTQYQQSLQELENLYGSLSQKAFRGELSVKQSNSITA